MGGIAGGVPGCGYDDCAGVVGFAVDLRMAPRVEWRGNGKVVQSQSLHGFSLGFFHPSRKVPRALTWSYALTKQLLHPRLMLMTCAPLATQSFTALTTSEPDPEPLSDRPLPMWKLKRAGSGFTPTTPTWFPMAPMVPAQWVP